MINEVWKIDVLALFYKSIFFKKNISCLMWITSKCDSQVSLWITKWFDKLYDNGTNIPLSNGVLLLLFFFF